MVFLAVGGNAADARARDERSTIGHGRLPQVALSDNGDVIAVWQHGQRGRPTIQAATWSARGRWSVPVTLGGGHTPRVAVDARGRAVAVWTTARPVGAATVRASTRTRGRWSRAVVLGRLRSEPAAELRLPVRPQVAVNRRGDAVVVWIEHAAGPYVTVEAATRSPGPEWTRSRTIGASTAQPSVAMADSGEAIAAWSSSIGEGEAALIESATRPRSGGWSAPEAVAVGAPSAFSAGDLSVGGDGTVTAIWLQSTGPPSPLPSIELQSSSRVPGAPWTAPVTIGPAVHDAPPRLATSRTGEALAVWNVDTSPGRDSHVQVSSRASTGEWGSPVAVMSSAWPAKLAMSASGEAIVVGQPSFRLKVGPDKALLTAVEVVTRSASGAWSPPRQLYRPRRYRLCRGARVAINASGRAAAVWYCTEPRPRNVMAAVLR